MWAFQYKHGDRPLEGYTIQRAAGRGGFGEVYYAVSDSGREVALKVVQGYEQIELRGISQCMNLKSPHLVTIFDVKHNTEGKPFVIMEYVSGPNLRQLLDESPAGLGTQKAAFFLREIAKGLTFLHECGIVHRDLKPANIFYENGYVKIGDYGLSKHITTSQYSGQTVTVGTVHYMAPEIGAGKYDRSIDIYAMGALLYEMLTGTPPYLGATPSEVLMKHLSSEPDVAGIPQPFARVIQRAMAKDPGRRYQTVQEMVEDVFGAEHVRHSVSVFSPEDLSIVAERAAKRTPVGVGAGVLNGGSPGSGGAPSSSPGGVATDEWGRLANWMDGVGGRVRQMWQDSRTTPASGAARARPAIIADPLTPRHRWQLAVLVSAIAPMVAMVAARRSMESPLFSFLFVFTAMWGGVIGVLVAHRALLPRLGSDSPLLQRLVTGQMVAIGVTLLALPVWASVNFSSIAGTLIAIIAPCFIFSSRDEMAWNRPERVGFAPLAGAGLAAFVLAMIFRGQWPLAVAAAAGITLICQVLAPWDPAAGARAKELKKAIDEAEEAGDEAKVRQLKAAAATAQGMGPGAGAPASPSAGAAERPPSPHRAAAERVKQYARSRRARYWSRPVWPVLRVGWVFGIVGLVTMGVMFCVAAGTTRDRYDVGPFAAAGVSALLFGALCIVKALQTTFYGWWGYLIKPVLMTACVAAIVSSAVVLGNLPYNPTQEDVMIGTLFVVLPSILFLVLLFIPGRWPDTHAAIPVDQPRGSSGQSPYQRRWALLLAALILAGFGGLHRIYVGKIVTGIIWLMTGGLFLIGQIVDVIEIFSGEFTDKRGKRLKYWESPSAAGPLPPSMPAGASRAEARAEWSPFNAVERAASDCCDAVKDVVVGVTDELTAQVQAWRKPQERRSPVEASPADVPSRASGAVDAYLSGEGAAQLNLRGLLSALAGLFIFAATILALALAIDVPGMLHAGVPTPDVKRELEANIFADFPEAWPGLLRRIGLVSIGALMLIALTLQAFARQRGGVVHMVRGIIGAVGLMLAMLPISAAMASHAPWSQIGAMVSQQQYTVAADTVLQSFQSMQALWAGVIFIVSIILLAWPAPRAREHRALAAPAAAPGPSGSSAAPVNGA